MKEIYLDNAASTPMPRRVINAVSDASVRYYANPFSLHGKGREALKALNDARKTLALELGVKPEEVIFTSGGTESNALALVGVAQAKKQQGNKKILISAIEHSSIYENARKLEREGFVLKEIPITEQGGIDFDFLAGELDNTAIVSVASVNSDTGIINDISKVAKMCKQHNITLHVDHSQGFGKLTLQPKSMGIDLMTADAHKIGGPKGVGFLYLSANTEIEPLFRGSEKTKILRPGTANTPGAIGFAAALKEYKKIDWKKVEKSRDALQEEMEKLGARTTAKSMRRVPGCLHICFRELRGEELVNYLSTKGIYCSTGSACDSDKKEKRILERLGVPREYHSGAIRFSLVAALSKKDLGRIVKETKSFLNRFKNA